RCQRPAAGRPNRRPGWYLWSSLANKRRTARPARANLPRARVADEAPGDATPVYRSSLPSAFLPHPLAYVAGKVFRYHDNGNDENQNRPGRIVLVAVHRRVESRSDAAGADDADHRRLPEVDVEPVTAQAD